MYRYPNGAPDMTFSEPFCAAWRLPRRLRSMNLARSYSAITFVQISSALLSPSHKKQG